MDFHEGNSDVPPFDPDGALLSATMAAVEARYEDVFEDADHTLLVNFWWDDLASLGGVHSLVSETGGIYSRETECNLRFDTRHGTGGAYKEFFFDPTPLENEEFSMGQVLYGSGLSESQQSQFFNGNVPDLLEVGYKGMAISGGDAAGVRDILSLAFHETGHALGMSSSNDSTVYETLDGDYDYDPAFVGGNEMAAHILSTGSDVLGHLEDTKSVMYPSLSMYSARTLPSATDIFAMAAGHHYVEVDLQRRDSLLGGEWGEPGTWEGNQVPDATDDVWVRHAEDLAVSQFSQARNLTVAGGSTVVIDGQTLQIEQGLMLGDASGSSGTGNVTVIDGGSLDVNGGTTIGGDGTLTLGSGSFSSRGIIMAGGELAASTATGEEGGLYLADVGRVSGYGEISLPVHLGTSGFVGGSGGELTLSGGVTGSGSLKQLTLGGLVDVGNSPGTLRLTDVVVDWAVVLLLEIAGTDVAEYDRLLFSGDLALDGTLQVHFADHFTPQASDTFQLIDLGTATVDGWFNSVATPAGWTLDGGGLLYQSIAAVPEPATLLLALVGLALLPRRRRQSAT